MVTPPAKRGRPKDLDKRAAILEAAKRLFLEKGYHGASMNRIAARADVSKLTLYSHYRDKDDLFRQCVIATCEQYTPPALYAPASDQSLARQLTTLGMAFNRMLLSDDAVQVYRMMAAEANKTGKLGRLFFAAGPQRTLDQFAHLLDAAIARGELRVPDRERAAKHFFTLLQGHHQMRTILGERPPGNAELKRHVDDVVALFLKAYAH